MLPDIRQVAAQVFASRFSAALAATRACPADQAAAAAPRSSDTLAAIRACLADQSAAAAQRSREMRAAARNLDAVHTAATQSHCQAVWASELLVARAQAIDVVSQIRSISAAA